MSVLKGLSKLSTAFLNMGQRLSLTIILFTMLVRSISLIAFTHRLSWHPDFELGRLHICMGDDAEGIKEFDLVLSGKYLEVGASGRKGKYSLEVGIRLVPSSGREA